MISRRFSSHETWGGIARVLGEDDTLIVSFELPSGDPRACSLYELIVPADLPGCSNAEIARRRGRSPRTVANQVASILKKLGLHSRLEVVAEAPLSRG